MQTAKARLSAWAAIVLATTLPLASLGCGEAVGSEPGLDANLVAGSQFDLTGTWSFNVEESERPSRPPRATDGPGGIPGPHREGTRQLVISQTDTTVSFGFGERTRTVFTDGRISEQEHPRGGRVQVQASWTEDGLVVLHRSGRGAMQRTYSLSSDGRQLYVQIRLSSERLAESVEFRHVFDRVSD